MKKPKARAVGAGPDQEAGYARVTGTFRRRKSMRFPGRQYTRRRDREASAPRFPTACRRPAPARERYDFAIDQATLVSSFGLIDTFSVFFPSFSCQSSTS